MCGKFVAEKNQKHFPMVLRQENVHHFVFNTGKKSDKNIINLKSGK